MQNVQQLLQSDPLVKLIQKENFIGWIYSIDYDSARVMTNDLWKANSLGVPHNCFLLAASFNPDEFASVSSADREVILLRVIGTCNLPQDDDLVRTKIDHFQSRTGIFSENGQKDFDDLTLNQIQFGGLECRVLGTFYTKDGQLFLGSDLESFSTATRLSVYRPRGAALEFVANHVDPLRRKSALEEAKQLGIEKPVAPFRIGTIRYTSTDRLHRKDQSEHIAVHIQPSDFLARRTAVLGMTRTGKSNMIKQLVSVVKRVADEGAVKIGQIIYDINGEYANANQQDKGAIADIYPEQTVRYRMLQTPGFEELQNNFYLQLTEGFNTMRGILKEEGSSTAADVKLFLNTSFEQPDAQEQSTFRRWRVRAAAYQAMLFKAGFEAPPNHRVVFDANKDVRDAVDEAAGEELKNPSSGLTLTFTSSLLSGSVLALPFWWIVGRGADALIALKRKAIQPRIRFPEAAISFLLLMGGALSSVFGIYAALSGDGSWMVAAAMLLWTLLGGVVVRAWQMQRRNQLAANPRE